MTVPGFDGRCFCGAAPDHAEHYHHRIRYFCERHTAWSGHYEFCGRGKSCAKLVAAARSKPAPVHAVDFSEEVLSSVTVDDELKEVQITGNARRMLEEIANAEGCTPREALKKMITAAWSRGEQN